MRRADACRAGRDARPDIRRVLRLVLSIGLGSVAVGCSPAPPSSVLLIIVDTLRADHLGLYGYERRTSPHLDAWAERGVVFEQAFSTSSWTLPSVGTIFTGQLPSRHLAGTFERGPDGRPPTREHFRRLDPTLPTLAEAARGAGLTTAAMINNAFLGPRFGVDRGFETYDFSPAGRLSLRRADVVVDWAVEWLADHAGSPFLLVLHLFDPHMTYDPPDATRGRFSSTVPDTGRPRLDNDIRGAIRRGVDFDREYLVAQYDEEIAFVDEQLGRLISVLDETGLDDDLVVVLTSDHGEELFDHGGFEHGHTMYNELLRVPLVIRAPDVEPERRADPVSLADLFPTLLAALGQPIPEGLPGRSLWPSLHEGPDAILPLVAERTLYGVEHQAIVDWPFKLIRRPDRDRLQLFDLRHDPAEQHDVHADRRDDTERLRRLLETALSVAATGLTTDEVEMDEETLRALRSLGYVR